MKYILAKEGATYTPVIFPTHINHDEMAAACGMKRQNIVGAGFVMLYEGKIKCYGESMSLNIKSNESDADAFNTMIHHL